MSEIEMADYMWAEQQPDCYAGETCDQQKARWYFSAVGDKDSSHDSDPIVLDPSNFPPGTKVVVSLPSCPDCGSPIMSLGTPAEPCECGFDWKEWADGMYG